MDFSDNLSLNMDVAVGEASPLTLKCFSLLVSCWFGAFPAVLLEISINSHHNKFTSHLCLLDLIILTSFIR